MGMEEQCYICIRNDFRPGCLVTIKCLSGCTRIFEKTVHLSEAMVEGLGPMITQLPDLSSTDYTLWRNIRPSFTRIKLTQNLIARLSTVAVIVRETPDIIGTVRQSFLWRYIGAYKFEHLLSTLRWCFKWTMFFLFISSHFFCFRASTHHSRPYIPMKMYISVCCTNPQSLCHDCRITLHIYTCYSKCI